MAVDDSGKQARLFPCLAILRYTVATVVTVLAVVVIIMVIAVGVHREDVSVSVVGHVSTTDLWNKTYVDDEPKYPPTDEHRRADGIPVGLGDGGTDDDYGRPLTRTRYTPVKTLSLEVALSVDNQSGRGSIYCRNISVTFRTGGSTSMAAGMDIGVLHLQDSFDFQAKPQISHKISRRLTVNDANKLTYIANTYGGESSFTGVVKVTMNTSSVVTLGHHTTPRIVNFVCSPVDFSVGDATATATCIKSTSVQCIKSN